MGALSTVSGISQDPDARAEYEAATQDAINALQKRQGTNWFSLAGALLAPTRTGSAFESLGKAGEDLGRQQEQDEAKLPQIAQMRAQLAGQKYQVAQEARDRDLLAKFYSNKNEAGGGGGAVNPVTFQNQMAGLIQLKSQLNPDSAVGKQVQNQIDNLGKQIEGYSKLASVNQAERKFNFDAGLNPTQSNVSQPSNGAGTPDKIAVSGAGTPDQIAVVQTESGGDPNAVSPKGAMGAWQVMPNTNKDPGFGVIPAKDDSKEELNRVGKDYWEAMKNRYGNTALAAVAYNAGPGFADKWIEKGGNPKELPNETRNYVTDVLTRTAINERKPSEVNQSLQKSDIATQADERRANAAKRYSGAPLQKALEVIDQSEIAQEEAQKKLLREEESKQRELAEKPIAEKIAEINKFDNLATVNNLNRTDRIVNTLDKFDGITGLLQKAQGKGELQDWLNAVYAASQEGLKVGNISISVPIEKFIQTKDLKYEEKVALGELQRDIAQEFLAGAKFNKGVLGIALTDKDTGLLQAASVTTSNLPANIRSWALNKRAEYETGNKMYQAYHYYKDTYGNAKIGSFFTSKDSPYHSVVQDHAKLLSKINGNSPGGQ